MEQSIKTAFSKIARSNTAHHAYLITGAADTLEAVVLEAQQMLLCVSGTGTDACKNCTSVEKRVHPDAPSILVEERQHISVSQVHELQRVTATTAQLATRTVAVIPLAHQLTIPAANALLKSLEEPARQTIFLLGSVHENQLLQTIVSRVQVLRQPKTTHHFADEQWTVFLNATAAERSQMAQKWFSAKMDHQDFKKELHRGMIAIQYALKQSLQQSDSSSQRISTAEQIQNLQTWQEHLNANGNKKMIVESLITSL
jgi:hypothetical protein